MDEKRGSGSILLKLVLIGFLCVIYLLYVVAVYVHGPVQSFVEHVGAAFDGDRTIYNADAGDVAEVIRSDGGSLEYGDVWGFDDATVLRVLDAVEEYNQSVRAEREVPYEYMHYVGMVDEFDPETGNAAVSDYVTETEVTEVVGTERVLVGYERRPTRYTQEDIDAMEAAFYTQYPQGTFYPPPLYFPVPVWEDRDVVETHTVIEEHEAVQETLTDTVTLSRTAVENAPEIGGENVFELDWRPILTLCAMIAQSRVEQDGTLAKGENGMYLTDAELLDVIHFFGYQYSYVDDGTAESGWDASFGRGNARNAAYRLEVSGDVKVGEVCDFTVKRIPQVAPKLIANAYMSYEYEYREKENGEWVLDARTVRVDGESFVIGCSEILYGFEPERFVMGLWDFSDGDGEVASRYAALAGGQTMEERTEDPAECPCIGTVVTKGTGWNLSHSSLFFVGRTGLGNDMRPSGADVISTDFSPAPEAMADGEFMAIYDKAASCLGTKYVFGGNGGPGASFDCSAFVSYVFKECGYPVKGYPDGRETTVSLLGGKVTRISATELKPGDLLFFKGTIKARGPDAVSHVAIWLGGGVIIHAGSSAGEVVLTDYESNSYLKEHFMCYARMKKE